MNDIRQNKETYNIEEERSRMQEMLRLKQLEKQYMENLKEFDGMKENLREIRKKYECAVSEKNMALSKYKTVLT